MTRCRSRTNELSSTTSTRTRITHYRVMALVLDASTYLLTMDGNITRCIDAQPHSAPAYVHDHQFDVRPNHNSFTAFSTQDQHGAFLLSGVEPVQIFWFQSGIGVHNLRPTGKSSFEQSTIRSLAQPRIAVNGPLVQAHLPFGACGRTFRCQMTTPISNPAYGVAPRFGTTRLPTARRISPLRLNGVLSPSARKYPTRRQSAC